MKFAFAILLLLGLGLRVAAFSAERSLWIDEAMVALNIVERSPARLFEPLDRNQGAPVGFLLATKASIELFGPSERAFRLPALLASVLGLFAFAHAVLKLLRPVAACCSLGLFAAAPDLVTYAAECKQYSSDAALAAGLLAVAVPFFQRAERRRDWFLFAIAGAAAVWVSHPALFVLAGLGLALFLGSLRLRWIAVGAVWLASFAAVYAVNLRHLGRNDYLLEYWAGHFAPLPWEFNWYIEHALGFAGDPGSWSGGSRCAAAGLVLLGIFGIVELRKPRNLLFAFAVTLVVTIVASGAKLYPFSGRLLLFLVPMASIIWGSALAGFVTRFGRPGWLSIGIALVWIGFISMESAGKPKRTEEIKPLLKQIESDWRPGDLVYVYGGSGDAGAGPAFDFYSPRFRIPPESVLRGGIDRDHPERYAEEIGKLPPGRIWVVITHRHKNEVELLKDAFDRRGPTRIEIRASGELWLAE